MDPGNSISMLLGWAVLLPLCSFFVILVFGPRMGKAGEHAASLATAAIALASILFPAFNQSAWKKSDPERALDWKKLGALVGIILLVNLAILTENPAVLYPIAILSVLGVLTLLITVFSVVWLLIMRQENIFNSLTQMWLPFLAGTTLALLMITAIDLLRFKLTGTWGGFPLG